MLESVLTISEIIKRYIKLRGHTLKSVANELNINYKTLSGILVRDKVDAMLLFKLANFLDIDLCWMAQLYEQNRTISVLDPYQMTRMNSEMRKAELRIVLSNLDRHIIETPASIKEISAAILKDYNHLLFYLLDVLLPESYTIRVARDRNKDQFYCMPTENITSTGRVSMVRGRNATAHFYEGHEMLKQIIIERKAEIEK